MKEKTKTSCYDLIIISIPLFAVYLIIRPRDGRLIGCERMKPTVDVKIELATEEDSSRIEQFLKKYFFPEEPMNSSLKRCPEEVPFLNVLKDGLCFKAVNALDNSEDNLLGVVLNKEVSLTQQSDTPPVTCPKHMKIKKILKQLDEKSRIWERVNNEKHFNIVCVSVNDKYRGLGLGKKLIAESLELAKKLGHKYVSIECSSYYSGQIAIAMGFQVIGEIPYNEYLDENGEQIFKVSAPHTVLVKLMKVL